MNVIDKSGKAGPVIKKRGIRQIKYEQNKFIFLELLKFNIAIFIW